MADNLLSLHERLREEGVLISFCGKLSQEIIVELGQAIRKYLETEDTPKTGIFSTFSIYIEQTQNINNYCAAKHGSRHYETIASSCIVTIGNADGGSKFVSSGNLVENTDIPRLEDAVQQVSERDKDALKALYKQKLKEPLPDDGQGAGMGLIDIARRASRPLEYSLKPVDENLSFFTLRAII